MVAKPQRKTEGLGKLHLLRALTGSKSVNRSSIILDALVYICKLKIKLQQLQKEYLNLMAIRNEYLDQMKHIPKVKVEKIGEGFWVRVTSKRGEDNLVSILEAFDEMGIDVLQARVSSNGILFFMEAIVLAQEKEVIDDKDVAQAVLKAIGREDVGEF